MAKLTEKQKRFVQEYLVDLNATAAAKRAGYSEKSGEADVDSLAAKYDAEPANTAVDDELAALKAQMGL